MKKHTKDIVGASVGLAVGQSVIGGIGGTHAGTISAGLSRGTGMLGVAATAGYAGGIMNMAKSFTKKKKKKSMW